MSDPNSERYCRQLNLPGFGREAQAKLRDAGILVIGAGGLGAPVLQYLGAMGVGRIGIVDDDVVSLSNLHRQVLYTTNEVGALKAHLAAKKIAEQNPEVDVAAFAIKLNTANALGLIAGYDLVVDATDNFAARYLINDACVILGKPFVYGAVHQYEGYLSVFNLDGGPTYRCLYPNPPASGEVPDCNTAGVLGVVPGIIGCRQALETVKIITGVGNTLSGYLQVFDFLRGADHRIRLKSQAGSRAITVLQENYDMEACPTPGQSIEPAMLREWYKQQRPFVLWDVREEAEFHGDALPGANNIPLHILRSGIPNLDKRLPLVVYCQKGIRSREAANLIRSRIHLPEVYELAGGIENWIKSETP